MALDARTRGARYLAQMTSVDVGLVAAAADPPRTAQALAATPEAVEAALAAPDLFEDVLPHATRPRPSGDGSGSGTVPDDRPTHATASAGAAPTGPLLGLSPFLVFAVTLHRCWADLDPRAYVQEWTGPRERVPVFAADELRAFLDDGDQRLFLVELLASYTHLTSGSVTFTQRGTVRRHRFSDLDLASMARLVEVVDERARPDVYRRLGDTSLFLTGVFPDHTATRRFAPIQVDRLARSLHATTGIRSDLVEELAVRGPVGLLEHLGQHWYRMAGETPGATWSAPPLHDVVRVGDNFPRARRVLNHLTDRWLFPFHAQWLPTPN